MLSCLGSAWLVQLAHEHDEDKQQIYYRNDSLLITMHVLIRKVS